MTDERTKGSIFAILGAISFGGMAFLVRTISGQIPLNELVFVRGLTGLLFFFPAVFVHDLRNIFSIKAKSLWLRSLAAGTSVTLYYYNIQVCGAANATAIHNTSPMIVMLLAWLIYKDRLRPIDYVAVIVVFTGSFALSSPSGANLPTSAIIVGFTGALTAAISFTALKKVARSFSSGQVVWAFSLLMIVVSLTVPGEGWVWNIGFINIVCVLGIALLGLLGQILMTKSYIYLSPSIASSLSLTSLVWSGLGEALLLGFIPNVMTIVSYGIIISGVVLLNMKYRRAAAI